MRYSSSVSDDIRALREEKEVATRHFFRNLMRARERSQPLYIQALTNTFFQKCRRIDLQIQALQQLNLNSDLFERS